MSFLEIEDLAINLGEFRLEGLSLSLEQGDYLNIIGPTGAGKTIFLESLVGFWQPDRGRIILNGRDIGGDPPERRHIGIVYQDYALLPHLTVYRNIAYGLKKKNPVNMEPKIREMAESLQIDHLLHRKPATLSGGEQQRAALARVLIVEPELLLMDEPFSALDQQTRRRARLLLKEAVRERGTTVIHITHDLDDVWAFADKVAVFRDGDLIQFGARAEVFNRPRNGFIADFVGATFYTAVAGPAADGGCKVDLGGMSLETNDRAGGGSDVKVAIRPEVVNVVSERPENANGCNVVEARLQQVMPEGPARLLELCANGAVLNVLLTQNAFQRLGAGLGDKVYALIHKKDVRIVDN